MMINNKNNNTGSNLSTRRQFLKNSFSGLGVIAVGTFSMSLISGCSDDSNPASPSGGNTNQPVTLSVDISMPTNMALATVGGALALDSNDIDDQGILLFRESDTVVKAFSRECTHQSCTIPGFQSGVSTCPCHGSRFNTSGSAIGGPATSPLKQYTAALSGNMITITG